MKPLANGYFHSESGPRAVFTSSLTREDLDEVDFSDAPFVAQEEIAARAHLRVVTVGGRAWAARLGAAGRPLDWRQQDEAHFAWCPTSVPEVEQQALLLASHLGVGYSSQDWLLDDQDGAVFIDLNPGGQWLFLPAEVSRPVTEAIAAHLTGGIE